MAPARSIRNGQELTVEIIHLPTRRWQLLQQTQIVAWFNKASEAQIPHLIYQQDTQITARTGDTLSGLPAGIIWDNTAWVTLVLPIKASYVHCSYLSLHKIQLLTQLGAEINGSASQSET